MYVMHRPHQWEDYLQLVEVAYNNGYQTSLKMSPFDTLYGKRYRTPVSWDNLVNIIVLGLEMFKEMLQEIAKIRQNLKSALDNEKFYENKNKVYK